MSHVDLRPRTHETEIARKPRRSADDCVALDLAKQLTFEREQTRLRDRACHDSAEALDAAEQPYLVLLFDHGPQRLFKLDRVFYGNLAIPNEPVGVFSRSEDHAQGRRVQLVGQLGDPPQRPFPLAWFVGPDLDSGKYRVSYGRECSQPFLLRNDRRAREAMKLANSCEGVP